MPEIKNTFVQGKMNKDLDERLVPNGQYRDAVNIEVSTAESSDVGVAKNILGNYRVEDKVGPGFKCVGSIENEQTNKIYWFVSTHKVALNEENIDAILEYDIVSDVTSWVFVDKYAGTYKAVLKFSGNIITGINIIDNLLFWTDNNSEPKKINIDECKKGTDQIGNTHTQLIFENGSFNAMTIDKVIYRDQDTNVSDFNYESLYNLDRTNGDYFAFQRKQLAKLLNVEFENFVDSYGNVINANNYATDTTDQDNYGAGGTPDGYVTNVRHYRDGKFLGIKNIKIWDNKNGVHARLAVNHDVKDWYVGDIIFGNDITLDIEERHITVIKPKPLKALTVKINHSDNSNSKYNIPNLFETKFPRFSWRYKFKDGEFSAFAPFTEPVFNPKYPKDTSVSSDVNIFYNKDNAYDIKEPYNKAMSNSIHSVELTDFITAQTPEDVVEIEILYKQEESSVIYSIGTIKQTDPEWHRWSNNEGENIGFGKQYVDNIGAEPELKYVYAAHGGYTKGKYVVTTENIYAALPANQLLRPWDNVPKKALAQEVTGNRIVYGNYVQNYDLNENINVSVSYGDRKNSLNGFETQGVPSVKSQRNYQLGVVYCDKYGRETPVFTSSKAAIAIPWQNTTGDKNASRSLQLNVSTSAHTFPEWVDSLKFFVKENSNQYYNLAMDRAWVTKSTYELDDSEGHLWISFPSSDRNKISEEDYIILKKKIGPGEKQVNFENKFKVIDIQNEAPDALKYELVNMGTVTNNSSNILTSGTDKILTPHSLPNTRPDVEGASSIVIYHASWTNKHGAHRASLNGPDVDDGTLQKPIMKDLYVSWRRIGTDNAASKKYKVTGGWKGMGGWVLNLASPVTKIDADIAHVNGKSGDQEAHVHQDLMIQVEKRVLKDSEDFSGKFFVKISKNQVTDLIESGNPVSILDQFAVKGKTSCWYWQDDVGSSPKPTSASYGLMSYNGYARTTTGSNHLHILANNGYGNAASAEVIAAGDAHANLKVTDFATPWENMRDVTYGPTFFIDSMHMAAGQSEVSDYAKYCCITWAGQGGIYTGYESTSKTESAWSYPPLKQWLSDFGDTSNMVTPESQLNVLNTIKTLPAESIWYENNLISTVPGTVLPKNQDHEGLRIDGWVGPLQSVARYGKPVEVGGVNTFPHGKYTSGVKTPWADAVNGLEGLIDTVLDHSEGPRKWFSGMTGTDYGVGTDTKTYADNASDIGRHFMHISFFAPGKDLHDGDWGGLNTVDSELMIYGEESFGANLQGIWGGGVFTGETREELFGLSTDDADKFMHFPMEGNYDSNFNYLPETPGPGVGYGYDTSDQPTNRINCRELHERQWDPTFNKNDDPDNKIRDFIRNLHAGARFRFNRWDTTGSYGSTVIDDAVYTIKRVQIKKLYNHTSWRKPYNRYIDGSGYVHDDNQSWEYRSVEQCALDWLDTAEEGSNGADTLSGISGTRGLKQKIEDFGASHNRRLCYIIELDKNPRFNTESLMRNPLSHNSENTMCADYVNKNFTDIEFLDPVKDHLLSDLSKFPAIWELDPKKQEVDLDIYYEASDNIPIKINEETNELFAPIGCKVEVLNSGVLSTSIIQSWDKHTAILDPGFPKGDGGYEIDYTGMSFKFIREDGSYTIAEAGLQDLDGGSVGFKTEFVFREDVGEVISSGLSWSNCFSFGNGVESNRIKDDFNEPFITNGVKASTITQQTYKQERRKNGLIYSGIYNSNSGVNNLNQFIMAEKITKDLSPTYGGIQKLFSRNSDLVTFCEDKVLKVLANKDALFNADGNTNLTATQNVLGQTIPFVGEYGISTNPESFASESYRAYFTDKQRGAVLRLSKDGLTPISKAGMQDWFRDNLREYNHLIGTYDGYKEGYNLTLSNNNFSENLLEDSFLDLGEALEDYTLGSLSKITNPGIANGESLQYLYEPIGAPSHDVLEYGNSNNAFDWSPFDQDSYDFKTTVTVVHHAAIPKGSLQEKKDYDAGQIFIAVTPAEYTAWSDGVAVGTGGTAAAALADATSNGYTTGVIVVPYVAATYTTASNLPDNGWWYDPGGTSGFMGVTNNLFGTNINAYSDPQHNSTIQRTISGSNITESGNISYPNSSDCTANVSISKNISWKITIPSTDISQSITRNSGGIGGRDEDSGLDGAIVFDRPSPLNSYVEFRNIGSLYNEYNVNSIYNASIPSNWATRAHRSFFNGDELHIQFEINCFPTFDSETINGEYRYGYNLVIPTIELYDGDTRLDNLPDGNPLVQGGTGGTVVADYQHQKTSHTDMGAPFEPKDKTSSTVYSYPSSVSSDLVCIKGQISSSPVVEFPDTQYATYDLNATERASLGVSAYTWQSFNLLRNWYPGYTSERRQRKITLGCSFKFRDPTQQNANGSKKAGIDNIHAAMVVNDLRIRIRNNKPAASSGWDQNGALASGAYPLRNQLWELHKLFIKKGYGITSHSEVASDPLNVTTSLTTAYDAGQPYIGPTAAVDPVPPHNVPAWTEISHGTWASDFGGWNPDSNSWNSADYTIPNTSMWIDAMGLSNYGNNYGKELQIGYAQNTSNPAAAPTTEIKYHVPLDWVHLASPASPPWGGSPYGTQGSSASNPSGYNYDRVNDGWGYVATEANGGLHHFNNSFIKIAQAAVNASGGVGGNPSRISYDISSEPWEIGAWYLVDIEYDFTYGVGSGGQFGTGNPNGNVRVRGVSSSASDIAYGSYSSSVNGSCKLTSVLRREYGTVRTILRGIFKVPSTAWVITNPYNHIDIRISECLGDGVKIEKIIVKKLNGWYFNNWIGTNGTNGNGSAAQWEYNAGTSNSHDAVHAFQKKHMYFENGRLNWEVPADMVINAPGQGNYFINGHTWTQRFNELETQSAPTRSTEGWELGFTVSKNQRTDNFSGSLRGFVAIDDGNNGCEGVEFDNITQEGNYLIKFNFSDDTSNYTDNVSNPKSWEILRGELGEIPDTPYSTGSFGAVSPLIGAGWSYNDVKDRIAFMESNNQVVDQEYAISDVQLTDSRKVFLGGSAGGWNFDGFNTSTDNYIYWDTNALNLVFENCPPIDPTAGGLKFINVNQQLNATIKRYEKYEVRFTHTITPESTAKLSLYYYNSDGWGFKISDIDSSTPSPFTANGQPVIVTIGDPAIIAAAEAAGEWPSCKWSNVNLTDSSYQADLKNSFVISVTGDPNSLIDGTIDNIEMFRVYTDSNFEDTTVTFSENVNGWTSFKTFVPENGVSVSKKYFTFDKGGLYQHYVPTLLNNTFYTQGDTKIYYTPKEADNYNKFYGDFDPSSITTTFNQEPSLVKIFNTLNYEGSQAYITTPSQPMFNGLPLKTADGDDYNPVNINNAIAFGGDISGWECQEIKTDLDSGSVKDFIEKEGKWFNYIRGKVNTGTLNTSLFSVQGVGVIQGISTEGVTTTSAGTNGTSDNGGTGGTIALGGGGGDGGGTGDGGSY